MFHPLRRWITQTCASLSERCRTRLCVTQLEDRTVPSTVRGIVYDDANRDGTREAGEALVTTGTVELVDEQGLAAAEVAVAAAEVAIAVDGSYEFTGVGAGTYTVQAVAADGVGSVQDMERVGLSGDPGEVFTKDLGLIYPAPVVSVATLNDAAEGGTDGIVRFSRTGDSSGTLTVSYSIGGTASPGADYTALSGTVTFAAGAVTADIDVHALHDGVNDPGETVVLTVTSGSGYTADSGSSATVNVIDTDLLPVAFDGLATTSENEAVDVSVIDLATSLYGDPLTVSGVTQGAHGTVTNQGGTATYTPDAGFTGDDAFTYTVEDPFGNEATGTVTVTVTGLAAPPTSVWTAQSTAVTVDVPSLAFDPDGETLTTAAVTQGAHGSVVVNSDGTVTYTPTTGFTGDDHFTYTVEDPDGTAATGTITVTVGTTDPVALDDTATTPVNTAVTVAVLDRAFQPAGGALTLTAVTQGAHGSVAINGDGTVTYTPAGDFTGTDAFTYTVTDANTRTATGTITVTVGTPAPTEADEIEGELSDLEGEIDNYDVNSPPNLTSVVSVLTSAINDYLSGVTTSISLNSIEVIGQNKQFDDFLKSVWPSIKQGFYKDLQYLINVEALVWNAAMANKQLIESLEQQWAAELKKPRPSVFVIRILSQALNTLEQVQVSLAKIEVSVLKESLELYIKYRESWNATTQLIPSIKNVIPAPPEPPMRQLKDLVPKKP
jgi:Bacterial Ig domain/SdrD B-like domain